MGTAAVARTSKIPMAITSSSRVNPEDLFRLEAGNEDCQCIWSALSLLHPDSCLARDHLDRPLLRILGVHLDD